MNMLLYLLFATAVAAECDTGTCKTCKTMTGCDWYGWACYNTSGTAKTLNIPATATCDVCQAGSCADCTMQDGCSWYKSNFGLPGKCATNTSAPTGYTMLDMCPPCNNYMTCDDCSMANETCGWYELAGSQGRCREAAPSFAWNRVKAGYCNGDPCANQNSCTDCKNVNNSICAWYESDHPAFYSSKCDSAEQGSLDTAFYTKTTATCPVCAGTTCTDCKKEANCKWVAVDAGVLGSTFGQCMPADKPDPTGKSVISTCPATCDLHSCTACQANSKCSWFTKNAFVDASCDLTTDAPIHIGQSPATTCLECDADRCYECNKLANCGWYVKKVLGVPVASGCYSKTSATAAERTLYDNSNPKCEGVPGSSAHVTVSIVVLAVLALVA